MGLGSAPSLISSSSRMTQKNQFLSIFLFQPPLSSRARADLSVLEQEHENRVITVSEDAEPLALLLSGIKRAE